MSAGRQHLKVDPTACRGHGLCAELLPEVVRLDDWGYPIIDPRPMPVPWLGLARRAVSNCPTLALRLESGEPASREGPPATAEGPGTGGAG